MLVVYKHSVRNSTLRAICSGGNSPAHLKTQGQSVRATPAGEMETETAVGAALLWPGAPVIPLSNSSEHQNVALHRATGV